MTSQRNVFYNITLVLDVVTLDEAGKHYIYGYNEPRLFLEHQVRNYCHELHRIHISPWS